MTKVLCGFKECVFIKDYDPNEGVGICSKEEIVLDERVEDIFVGCPDTKWTGYVEWKGGTENE